MTATDLAMNKYPHANSMDFQINIPPTVSSQTVSYLIRFTHPNNQ
jgi:hypothetical protein